MSVRAVIVEGEHYLLEDRGVGTSCWIWIRGTSAGRPIFHCDGKNRNAHRVAWEQTTGQPLDSSVLVLRRCLALCVNPEHCTTRPRRIGQPRRRANPEDQRRWNLRKYGITPEDYETLLERQGGVCAVCGRTDSGDRLERRLHVDHDHETGAIRGLLCSRCNNAIGQASESADRLRALARYLDERSAQFL